ncbi:HDOD domain-containing protein [Piscinibacter sakaiensis]|uniref:HDOD domain-containing protein n=1 Tax=Piscinibacter sakaiensis TaxID=1547922 RepID=UPI003AB06899
MPVDPLLRSLNIDLPTPPTALVRLAGLLGAPRADVQQIGELIESEMALASAVLKAVNSSLYGLTGRVQTVRQAITYLGTREIAAVTYAMGLRAVFPVAHELEPLWKRAALRGMLMGRMGEALNIDPWTAHSAGLFEECGKAVLFRFSPPRYLPLLLDTQDDAELVYLEHREFGVSHDALGAALCESWGLAPAAVQCVRHHVDVTTNWRLPRVPRPAVCALSALAKVLMTDPARLDEAGCAIAAQAGLDQTLVLRGARRVQQQLLEIHQRMAY